jgi:hypothetical protein
VSNIDAPGLQRAPPVPDRFRAMDPMPSGGRGKEGRVNRRDAEVQRGRVGVLRCATPAGKRELRSLEAFAEPCRPTWPSLRLCASESPRCTETERCTPCQAEIARSPVSSGQVLPGATTWGRPTRYRLRAMDPMPSGADGQRGHHKATKNTKGSCRGPLDPRVIFVPFVTLWFDLLQARPRKRAMDPMPSGGSGAAT